MVDIHSEEIITLSQAARFLPGRPHLSTIHRWRLRGIRGVKLETLLVGGRRFTSREALERFCERVTAIANGKSTPQRTNRQRTAAVNRANRELDRAGI